MEGPRLVGSENYYICHKVLSYQGSFPLLFITPPGNSYEGLQAGLRYHCGDLNEGPMISKVLKWYKRRFQWLMVMNFDPQKNRAAVQSQLMG